MQLFHTTDIDGISELNPTADKMRELLDSLKSPEAAEAEHPDVSLVHDASGWSISVYPSGIVTLDNLDEPDDAPRFMSGLTRNQALELWLELSKGEIQQLTARAWRREKV